MPASTNSKSAVKLVGQERLRHARLILNHYAAEQADKKFLLPEDIWEVWKRAGFDFPMPMTKTEQTKLDNLTEYWGALSPTPRGPTS